ncbi:ABC transporter permease [Litoreibacter arenae]|uniref:Cell processes protein n=1 Tax=Litoreibacter arenae DSM 19593 TaxID=1123360 RepID=S9RS76_9RHOB|nr:ABC transporter permease [Litoreibacter arenae]EPX76834.1 cell processes protein [Litoreibacter arenae DSM 19593]
MGLALTLIAQRISLGILMLFAVSALIFVGTQILPGDVAESILGQSATPENLANLRKELGLNEPALTRYFNWLGGIMVGDLGTALTSGASISEAITSRLGNTLFLAAVAAMISVPIAILLGLFAVRYKDRWPDKLISASTLASISLPEFFIGYLLILVFGVKLGWFPTVATVYDGMSFGDRLNAVMLPALTLTLVVLAHMMRMTRAAILNVMQSAYIETAELKGLSSFKIIWKHALPNAISPVINVVMLNMAYLIVGVVVVEVIFVYPGMGQYLVDHVSKRDVPVVQACGLIFAAIYIGLNLVADIISVLSNPRLRHPK